MENNEIKKFNASIDELKKLIKKQDLKKIKTSYAKVKLLYEKINHSKVAVDQKVMLYEKLTNCYDMIKFLRQEKEKQHQAVEQIAVQKQTGSFNSSNQSDGPNSPISDKENMVFTKIKEFNAKIEKSIEPQIKFLKEKTKEIINKLHFIGKQLLKKEEETFDKLSHTKQYQAMTHKMDKISEELNKIDDFISEKIDEKLIRPAVATADEINKLTDPIVHSQFVEKITHTSTDLEDKLIIAMHDHHVSHIVTKKRFIIALAILIVLSFALFNPSILGFVVYNQYKSEIINQEFNANHIYEMILEEKPTQLGIEGYVQGPGIAKVYLEENNQRYLIFDSTNIKTANNPEKISFTNTCLETCSIKTQDKKIRLLIKTEDAKLKIDKIDYTYEQDSEKIMPIYSNEIKIKQQIEDRIINSDSIEPIIIDLSIYFEEGEGLTYLVSAEEGLTFETVGSKLLVQRKTNFAGQKKISIAATNGQIFSKITTFRIIQI